MKLNIDIVPKNLDEAVECILAGLEEADEKFILEHTASASVHHGFGTSLRNGWSLWDKETILNKWFQDNLGLAHGDDLSGIILASVWAKVREEKFDLEKEVTRYKEHWKKSGVDPITGAKI